MLTCGNSFFVAVLRVGAFCPEATSIVEARKVVTKLDFQTEFGDEGKGAVSITEAERERGGWGQVK